MSEDVFVTSGKGCADYSTAVGGSCTNGHSAIPQGAHIRSHLHLVEVVRSLGSVTKDAQGSVLETK
jgi:hypothetical protein